MMDRRQYHLVLLLDKVLRNIIQVIFKALTEIKVMSLIFNFEPALYVSSYVMSQV